MSVLLTGGAGFIGSHTCVELLNSGEDIVVLDDFSNAEKDVINKIVQLTGKTFPVYAIDILDEDALRQLFQTEDIESVIHFAGKKAVGESVAQPLMYYHNNVSGLISLCRIMKEFCCKRLVFSSSATVYGDNPIPYKETYPISNTSSPYGRTKIMVETILQDIYTSDPTWDIALLRYFNPIGAHESGLIGEHPQGIPNNLLPYIMQVATRNLKQLSIFGNDYDTKDGTCIRDYLHVMDLATGHLDALLYLRKEHGLEAFNLGTGQGYSVLDIVHTFEKVSGETIPYEFAPRRAGDLPAFYADPTKAKEKLGWNAKRSLEEMCADAWRYISMQKAH